MPKRNEVQLRGTSQGTGASSGTVSFTTTREFLQQNPWYTGALVFLILVPPVIVAMIGANMPAWAAVLVSWFVGLLAAVVGLRALKVVRERKTS